MDYVSVGSIEATREAELEFDSALERFTPTSTGPLRSLRTALPVSHPRCSGKLLPSLLFLKFWVNDKERKRVEALADKVGLRISDYQPLISERNFFELLWHNSAEFLMANIGVARP